MVDIHSHILPGLDDGAKSMEDTLDMLRIAAASGTTDIVATPHADGQYRYHPGIVKRLIEDIQHLAGDAILIHRGCDFHLFPENVEDALLNPDRYTVNGKNYILVELDDFMTGEIEMQYERLEAAGIKIILTHPERNPTLREHPDKIAEWVAQGRLMQVTAQSITGRFGPVVEMFTKQLIQKGLVHFVASDAHNAYDRTPRLQDAYAWMVEHHSEHLAGLLFETHPRAVIEGKPIDLKKFPPPKPSVWSKLFGKS